jgi:ABC-2 type transport system ATP-binding protein
MQVTIRSFIKQYNERFGATLMLTSHYMDDVAALCPRVIVIDKGQLSFDGSLEDLVRRVRPEKRVMLHLQQQVSRADVEGLGQVVSLNHASAVLQVPMDTVNATISRALATLPIKDLTVENPPLEEVMSELFSRSREARNAAGGEGAK